MAVLVDTVPDNAHSDTAVLDYAMCVSKILQMQRVFLTENENNSNQPSDTTSTTVPGEELECKDASLAASSSITLDTASTVDSSRPQASESDNVTLQSQTATAEEMDLSHGQTDDLIC